jgi:ribosomal protein L10
MPRTTIELSKDNFNRLRKYCLRQQVTMKKATNKLMAHALNELPLKRNEKAEIPSFPLGIKIDPADRDALFTAMGDRL